MSTLEAKSRAYTWQDAQYTRKFFTRWGAAYKARRLTRRASWQQPDLDLAWRVKP